MGAALGGWLRLLAVAAAYGIAFGAARRAFAFSIASPWFVCVAMVCFLGLAAVTRPVVRIRMPRPLRRIRDWETGRGVYRALAVPRFGGLLRGTPLRLLNRDVYLKAGARETSRLSAELEAAEASHFWAAVLVAPYMVHLALLGAWTALLWVSLAQVTMNVYPIMHLRLTRGRLDRLAARNPASRRTLGEAPPSPHNR